MKKVILAAILIMMTACNNKTNNLTIHKASNGIMLVSPNGESMVLESSSLKSGENGVDGSRR